MQCKRCGALLESGSVYCPSCGEEVQLITEDGLEDDILSAAMKDEESRPYSGRERLDAIHEEMDGRRRKRKRIIGIFIFLAILIIAAVIIVTQARNHSENYMLQKANAYYKSHDYDSSMEYLDRILAINPDNPDALLLAAKICYSTKDLDRAEQMALHYLELVPDSTDGYRTLLKIYSSQGRYDDILSMSDTVTDPDILSVFDEFLIAMPSANKAGGDYEDELEITLTSPDKADIYYTLDGSKPDESSELYDSEELVVLDEEGDITLSAVCIDAKGHKSRVMTEEYKLTFPEAKAPEVSPEGGEFDEQTYIHISVEDGATAYYDWDDEPEPGGEEYSGSIRVREGNHVLQVISVNKYGKVSDVVKYNFIYYPPVVEEPEPAAAEGTGETTEAGNTETTEEGTE